MEKELFSYEADGSALIIHLPGEVDHHNCITLKYETDLLLEENYINRLCLILPPRNLWTARGSECS